MYNSENVLQGRIKKKYDFTGKQKFVSTPMSFSGGVGSGSIPTSNAASYEGAILTAKSVYAKCQIQREAIKASMGNEGAFVQATKETVKKNVESYMRNASRILFGDGSGVLGVGGTATNVTGAGTAGNPYVVTIADDTYVPFILANFEEKDHVNVVTGNDRTAFNTGGAAETTALYISDVTPSTRTIKLVGTSARLAALAAAGPFANTDALVMQNSYGVDPVGLKKVVTATTGTLYNISVQRRWQGSTADAAGAGINPDLMNARMLDIEKKFGQVPNLIVTSYEQLRNMLAFMEDQKQYTLDNRNIKGDLKGMFSFKGVEFMSTRGPVGVFVDRFCAPKDVWFLNDNHIEVHHRPDFGWFDDDGTVFLRDFASGSDSYSALYGGYYDNWIIPTAHGQLTGLAV